jgi:large subunit ribosomal protein L30
MTKVKVTLIKSTNGSLEKHKATIMALGLRKIGQTVEKNDCDAFQGMIKSVAHLVKVTQD